MENSTINIPIDKYPIKPLSEISEKPIAKANFREPVFKLGKFQDRYIEVEVDVYPVYIKNYIGVRFGQMNVLRFVDKSLLYNINSINNQ